MLKTKMGVSIALVGAAMYFLGAIAFTPAVLLAGAMLIMEDNQWVKRQAAKMIGVVIVFSLLGIAIGWIDDVVNVLNIIVHWFAKDAKYLSIPGNIESLLRTIIGAAEEVLLVVMGFMALKMKEIRFGVVDKLLDRFMNNNQ